MSGSAVAVLAEELASTGELLKAQTQAGMDKDEVLQSLFASWVNRLSNTKLNNQSKTMLTASLKRTPFSPGQVKELAGIILGGGPATTAKKGGPLKSKNQKCLTFENFVRTETMCKLRSTSLSRVSKACMIASEGSLVGLVNPDQPTLFRMVALLAWVEQCFDMPQPMVFDCMDKIQNYLKSMASNTKQLPYIVDYPVNAEGLPESHQAVYEGNLPPELDIPELSAILAGKLMRGRPQKTSKDPAWLAEVPEEHKASVRAAIAGRATSSAPAPEPTQVLAPASQPEKLPTAESLRFVLPPRMATNTPRPAVGSLLASYASTPTQEEGAVPIEWAEEGAYDGEALSCEDADAAATIEEMERKMVDAAASKAAAGKAAADKAANRNIKKRPAASSAAKPVCKRPAANAKAAPMNKEGSKKKKTKKPLDMKNVFKELRWVGATITRNKFTSRAYHAAETVMKRQTGKSKTQIKKYAREMFAKASKLYDQLGA